MPGLYHSRQTLLIIMAADALAADTLAYGDAWWSAATILKGRKKGLLVLIENESQ